MMKPSVSYIEQVQETLDTLQLIGLSSVLDALLYDLKSIFFVFYYLIFTGKTKLVKLLRKVQFLTNKAYLRIKIYSTELTA